MTEPLLGVVIDTREQRAWEFSPERFVTRRAKLDAGDYSLNGLEGCLALERKNLGDLVNSTIHGWIRFRKELNRLSSYDCAAIVVEANIEDVLKHRYESEADPLSVMGRVNGIFLDHGIPVFFWGPRAVCVQAVERFLLLAARKLS